VTAFVENGEWLGCGACAGFGFVTNIMLNIAPIGVTATRL